MSRNLAIFAVIALAVFAYMTGGRLGPVDLSRIPTPFLAFVVASVLVVFGISRI